MTGRNPRTGAALALMLLLIAALSALGFGALTLARRQAVAARLGEAVLQASLAAEAGALSPAAEWPAGADSLPVGSSMGVTGGVGRSGTYAVRLVRLGGELFLAEATGRHAGERARARAWTALWRLDPLSRLAAAPAVVVHGEALEIEGTADVEVVLDRWGPADPCPPWSSAPYTAFPRAWPARDASLPETPSAGWSSTGVLLPFLPLPDPAGQPALGLLSIDSLLAVAASVEDPLSAPAPSCQEPADEGIECPAGGVFRIVPGSVASRGALTGVVVSAGDLVLGGDAVLRGWVLARGDLTLREAARIEGFVQVGGGVRLSGNARILGDPCPAAAALEGAWLRRPRLLSPGPALGPPA